MDPLTIAIAAAVFIVAAILFLAILFSVVRHAFRFIGAILANSIVGLVALIVLGFVGVKIPLTTPVIVSIALFGLGALGTLLIFLFSGVALA
ncbi:MAG: hypothetical protein PHF51_00400 [Candidatus ainarchaeum sp.]|nr:hypothetical protein [Candidatus ainarchaeum sp.]